MSKLITGKNSDSKVKDPKAEDKYVMVYHHKYTSYSTEHAMSLQTEKQFDELVDDGLHGFKWAVLLNRDDGTVVKSVVAAREKEEKR